MKAFDVYFSMLDHHIENHEIQRILTWIFTSSLTIEF